MSRMPVLVQQTSSLEDRRLKGQLAAHTLLGGVFSIGPLNLALPRLPRRRGLRN
jgi:hypothetical protein